jgi:conserved hypothetical protein, ribA/ribD-fused
MKITDKYVLFWKEHPMCNFTKCHIKFADPYYVPLENDPIEFTSSEQMFMWFKAVFFGDDEMAEKILQSQTPQEARDLGQLVRNYNDEKWDKVRVDRMRTAVRYKFYQNEDLRKRLMDTKYEGKTFVEASYYDRIWGVGYNENDAPDHVDNWGRNELGKILTDLRNEFKAKRS